MIRGLSKSADIGAGASRRMLSGAKTVGRKVTVRSNIERTGVDSLTSAQQRRLGSFLATADPETARKVRTLDDEELKSFLSRSGCAGGYTASATTSDCVTTEQYYDVLARSGNAVDVHDKLSTLSRKYDADLATKGATLIAKAGPKGARFVDAVDNPRRLRKFLESTESEDISNRDLRRFMETHGKDGGQFVDSQSISPSKTRLVLRIDEEFPKLDDPSGWRKAIVSGFDQETNGRPNYRTPLTREYLGDIQVVADNDVENPSSLLDDVADQRGYQAKMSFKQTGFEADRAATYSQRAHRVVIEPGPKDDDYIDMMVERSNGQTEYIEQKSLEEIKADSVEDKIFETVDEKFRDTSIDTSDGTRIAELDARSFPDSSLGTDKSVEEIKQAVEEAYKRTDTDNVDKVRIVLNDRVIDGRLKPGDSINWNS